RAPDPSASCRPSSAGSERMCRGCSTTSTPPQRVQRVAVGSREKLPGGVGAGLRFQGRTWRAVCEGRLRNCFQSTSLIMKSEGCLKLDGSKEVDGTHGQTCEMALRPEESADCQIIAECEHDKVDLFATFD